MIKLNYRWPDNSPPQTDRWWLTCIIAGGAAFLVTLTVMGFL